MIVERLYESNSPHVNEERYYMKNSNLDFNRTAGAKDGRIKGLFKAAPVMLLSAVICWPLALLAGIGSLAYRWQKRWEDRDAKRHMLTPQYWTDYLANSHKSDERDEEFRNKSVKDKERDIWGIKTTDSSTTPKATDTSVTTNNKQSNGLPIGNLEDDLTPEERKTQAYKEYWITFSNKEIVRVRAFSEQEAKTLGNYIVKCTKPVYDKLNNRISQMYGPKYIFYLDTGEIVQWSAKDKKTAYNEAIDTRKDLCEIFNKEYPGLTKATPMELPKKAIKAEARKGEKIELPKQNSFVITTTKPTFQKNVKDDKPLYEWGTLKQFKSKFFLFTTIYFPSENERDAEKIIRDFFDENKNDIKSMMNDANIEMKAYKIRFEDNDVYHIPGKTKEAATALGKKLHDSKINIITKNMNGVNLDDWEELVLDFDNKHKGTVTLKSIKSVEDSPEKFSPPKNPKSFKLIKTLDKQDSVEYGPYNLW